MLKRDLLLTASMCHDIGKVKELSAFPTNDYTDDGQFLGHIVMGSQMVAEKAAQIPGFPHQLLIQVQHCILAHHGKYEYASIQEMRKVVEILLGIVNAYGKEF